MKPDEIRESFLRFFEERGHRRMSGAPLVPTGDPTLLFTSAGMVQFKPYFMGQAKPPHPRLTTVQKCFRTSDIDSVGDTSHLTFFEMLGNFSVGDYFKAEAVPWAWEYVTSKQWLGLDPDRLWAAVYLDDDEAFDLWRTVGLPEERIRRYGEEQNYWFSGDVGPCGPCSELHYDFGPEFGCGPDCEPDHEDCDRFLEIWNLVFMTYYCDGEKRTPLAQKNIDTGAGLERMAVAALHNDAARRGGSRAALKRPSVYDTDLFAPIITRIEELSGKRYGEDAATDRAMRIVAEHARAVTFLIGDERTPVIPSNEERGYAVRRVLRRAVYFGRRDLGLDQPFLTEVAETVIRSMAAAYPELEGQRKLVLEILGPEEQRFEDTLNNGFLMLTSVMAYRSLCADSLAEAVEFAKVRSPGPENAAAVLEQHGFQGGENVGEAFAAQSISDLFTKYLEALEEGDSASASVLESQLISWPTAISGEEAFAFHDTYGFPLELTAEIARERGFTVDVAGFEAEMEKQRERGRLARPGAAARGAEAVAAAQAYAALGDVRTEFVGYETLETETEVVALLAARGEPADVGAQHAAPLPTGEAVTKGQPVEILLAETPFYPEGGGQVGDRGEITAVSASGGAPNGRVAVEDTQRVAERLIVHRGRVVEGRIAAGDTVTARVDPQHRADTMRNHTGTHLLHAALRKVLGTHVRQAGSLVAPDHLRFDFTHTEPLSEEQVAEVQRLVNEKIRQDLPVDTRQTTYDQAMAEGVLAFFGEKYGEEVRVVEVNSLAPKFSAELCGGTHCHRTGEIGMLIVTGESSIGAGMRRIEALSGRGAEEYVRAQLAALEEVARRLGAPRDAVPAKLEALLAELDARRKTVERLERALAAGPPDSQVGAGKRETHNIDGVSVSTVEVEVTSEQALRFMGDALKKELAGQTAAAVIGALVDDRPSFLAVASEDAAARGLRADALVREIARLAGGGGGGRADLATGGGKDPAKLAEALKQVPDIARKLLAGK
ncbi:MAG: alanine--tRNA ligase [Dehalococcoidia bacterium]|nr:alanine--tRNA ligase [Dehalococcoidia bacterium]